jgi:hypothetical protein
VDADGGRDEDPPPIEPLRDTLAHPLVRRSFPGDDSDRGFHIWTERELYLDVLDRLPQTVFHLDLFRRNLFARQTADGDDQTVIIDWAFVGRGPIGADLSPLVVTSADGLPIGKPALHVRRDWEMVDTHTQREPAR